MRAKEKKKDRDQTNNGGGGGKKRTIGVSVGISRGRRKTVSTPSSGKKTFRREGVPAMGKKEKRGLREGKPEESRRRSLWKGNCPHPKNQKLGPWEFLRLIRHLLTSTSRTGVEREGALRPEHTQKSGPKKN